MAIHRLAYALGGGGARGALQVGAIRALLQAKLSPDVVVGTSAGAINATYLAIRGLTETALDGLEEAWHAAARARLLPRTRFGLTARMLMQSAGLGNGYRLREFFVRQGLPPDLRFRNLNGHPRLFQVAANLTSGRIACYGIDPDQSVLEGLLASTAIPPWGQAVDSGSGKLVDGWAVSNLPIQPAMAQGASAIIAFDLNDPGRISNLPSGPGKRWLEWLNLVEQRQQELELALAEARGIPVFHLRLYPRPPLRSYDFTRTAELIAEGYRHARAAVADPPDFLLSFSSFAAEH